MSSKYGENSKPKATSDAYRNSSFWDKKEEERNVMKIKGFGTIDEVDGIIRIMNFHFEGKDAELGAIGALRAIIARFEEEVSTLEASLLESNRDKKEEQTTAPEGAEYLVKEVYYKVGQHGFVYMWLTDSWVRSTKPVEFFKNFKRLDG